MMELVVVLAVTILLTSLLFPALSNVRENLDRVLCASNARQFGLGTMMFAKDNSNKLPESYALGSPERVIRLKQLRTARRELENWDGLGQLYWLGYCDAPESYFCPSHHGTTVLQREQWTSRENCNIFTNYHYSGHVHWTELTRRRRLEEGHSLVLVIDALATEGDVNHEGAGMNSLRGDGSVRWHEQSADEVERLAATSQMDQRGVWGELERLLK